LTCIKASSPQANYTVIIITETSIHPRECPMQTIRKIIEIDEELCDGCGQCVPNCAEGSIQIINGKAKVVADNLCDGLGACLGHCPRGALSIVERPAEAFDPEAVERFLAAKATHQAKTPSQCPSARMQKLQPCPADSPGNSTEGSALSHWPVQIRLIPTKAPFLKDADLLVTADCAAVACPSFHADYLAGKVVMMGCPKFDDTSLYLEKFIDIFRNNPPRSITVLRMEVPCCGGLPGLIQAALQETGATIPLSIVTLSTSGKTVQPL
jgi:ferredoxin